MLQSLHQDWFQDTGARCILIEDVKAPSVWAVHKGGRGGGEGGEVGQRRQIRFLRNCWKSPPWLLDGRCEISGEVELDENSLKISQLTQPEHWVDKIWQGGWYHRLVCSQIINTTHDIWFIFAIFRHTPIVSYVVDCAVSLNVTVIEIRKLAFRS